MNIRIPEGVDIPSIVSLPPALKWHTLKCELVTPMYGGGVKSTVVDKKMPIRASAIRGQLRFWWRLLAEHKWKLGDGNAIRDAEFKIWGGMGAGDEDGVAGQVFLRVSDIKRLRVEQWADYRMQHNGKEKLFPRDWANVPYVLFPAQGRTEKNPNEEPHDLSREGLKWILQVAFDPKVTDEDKKQIWEAVRWWSNFGGVGARTRRGLGAVLVEGEYVNILKPEDVAEISNISLVTQERNHEHAYGAWKGAVEKLQSFRQASIGRPNNSSRSNWPEPDAIRNLTGQSSNRHSERKTHGDFFPRAAFGLPITFIFKDGGDPNDTTLKLVHEDIKIKIERMSSPLILRPYFDGTRWYAMALVLPYNLETVLKTNKQIKLMLDKKEVKFWDGKYINEIKPIKDNGGDDPIQAFLTYFAD